ncbi:hypothetical protein QQ008_10490 [Fulvivirgaceae bacterium BMA10]|uniref:Uncharacterized protein n=1 Tax=Splendidivirga corallicola TaxID=3051826 RepID=A0ABT8KQJ2_9BACT|nr:hypothetical protein [Fulvivirgaceae bacterium BMA10]
MEQLELENIDFLKERNLEDLHYSSKQWLFNIDFWRQELNFFQNLLDTQAKHVTTVDQKKQIDHFQNLIIYYQGELLDEFHQKVRRHEKRLKNLLINNESPTDLSYRENHNLLFDQIISFDNQFKKYKLELYSFMSQVISSY